LSFTVPIGEQKRKQMAAAFRLPDWATTPTRTATLTGPDGGTIAVDLAPAAVFGAAQPAAAPAVAHIPLPPPAAPEHAAVVHHGNGKAYLIDLGAVSWLRPRACVVSLIPPFHSVPSRPHPIPSHPIPFHPKHHAHSLPPR
jgi:hypothetical protein